MASGLVAFTNLVAVIPELINEKCVALAEDCIGLVKSIEQLYRHPKLFEMKSENLMNRIKQ